MALSEGNRIRLVRDIAGRGLIKDRNNIVMVRNKPAFRLELDSTVCGRKEEEFNSCINAVENITRPNGIDYDRVRLLRDLKEGKQVVVVASGLTKEQILPLEPRLLNTKGFYISTHPQRDYIYGESSAHVLGYVGGGDMSYPNVEGKTGVEEFYNSFLTGVDGGELIQVDASGQKVETLSHITPIPGKDINLFLDSSIQTIAYNELKKVVMEKKAVAGAVIATDPITGGVLGLVSYPAFDPNTLSTGLKSEDFEKLINDSAFPFFNRAVSAVYPPASTFKMMMASAGLMEKTISKDTTIDDKGYIQVGSFIFRNWKLDGHGIVNVLRALQVSNDTFFYSVGGGYQSIAGLGMEKISSWAEKFRYGKLTGIDISGEAKGHMPDGKSREWYLGDTYITSIGQGDVLATPLQVNLVTSYFANGGKFIAPRVVKAIDNQPTSSSVLAENIIDETTYSLVREGLKLAVMPGGTGYPFFDFPSKYGVEVAGKTGTAEFGYGDKINTHAWFTVWGPFSPLQESAQTQTQEKPKRGSIVVTVFLEEGGSGADNAAPIARKIFDYWFGPQLSNQNRNP
uniref:Penicillin-binding protein 2 n=1 Tax=candidate division WWE3 bacterium TaxID=2053526 RepID=A0A7C4TJA9_UNCKA